METAAEDRRVAVRALEEQTSPSLLPMWRTLAQEPEGPFAREAVDGLLRCGGDGEVALVLATLPRLPGLAVVASLEKSPSAATLRNHLSLWHWLHHTTHARGRLVNRLQVPPAEAYPQLLAAEARLVSCLGPGRTGTLRVNLRVTPEGLPTDVEVTEGNFSDTLSAEAAPCVKQMVQRLVFPKPVPVADPMEALGLADTEKDPTPQTAAIFFTVTGEGLQ